MALSKYHIVTRILIYYIYFFTNRKIYHLLFL